MTEYEVLYRWQRTGLLTGLDGRRATATALLLEYQSAALGQPLASRLVGSVFGSLLRNELLSADSLRVPSALLFYIE